MKPSLNFASVTLDSLRKLPISYGLIGLIIFSLIVFRVNLASLKAEITLGEATPLVKAVEVSNYSEVRNQIIAGQNPNSKTSLGKTLLMVAVMRADVKMMDLLKSLDADLNYADEHGDTPLIWAVRDRKIEGLTWLINHNVNLDATNSNGESALLLAAKLGFDREASQLLKAGADPTLSDYTGRTAKDWAATSRNPGLVKLFP